MDIRTKGLKVAFSLSLLMGLSACCTNLDDVRSQINAAQSAADQALIEAQNCQEACDRYDAMFQESLRK